MRSILETCRPRPEIISGTFNPEIFTASLGPVIQYYRTGKSPIDSIYSDGIRFFTEATYPTQGLVSTLAEVFGRIEGDSGIPAIHRLETAFGGGKTHTLISCTHVAHMGKKLIGSVHGIIDESILPEPGSVKVVGISGDEIPVHNPSGDKLLPYTLWGEIAYQIGGEALYNKMNAEVKSFAAPGKEYFEQVLSNHKVLIMLDELAQYAARLEAARPHGSEQLSAFLMALHGYARNNPGISIILTLASASDAFGKQTAQLAQLLSSVQGHEISQDDARLIGDRAVQGVTSVVARDAVQVTPVQASEISAVLAKRIFITVDESAAAEIAGAYHDMYQRNRMLIPEEATSPHYLARMTQNYPIHPTLIDYLNNKLTDAENFQGTRGVLRVLSLAVRNIWQAQKNLPMIHACHLDMRSDKVVNELLGRTGSSDLMFVLNTDIGSIETGRLENGRSNAEMQDSKNPHPEGYPLYEYTWKTVFLNSLVGRGLGLDAKIFGISEADALLATSFPGMSPPQVKTALEAISETAYYLRFEREKYYAHTDPTINSVVAAIRKQLTAKDVKSALQEAARKNFQNKSTFFDVQTDASQPEHLPDKKGKPVLGVIDLFAEKIDVMDFITYKGPNMPREAQNLVFLLVPRCVEVDNGSAEQMTIGNTSEGFEVLQRLDDITRQFLAMKKLKDNPASHGVNPRSLDSEFEQRLRERANAMVTESARAYTSLFFPSMQGFVVRKEIQTAGGEGGLPFFEIIRTLLVEERELVTAQHTALTDLTNLSKLFFGNMDLANVETLQYNFSCTRSWPVLESKDLFDRLIREGVNKGIWCLYRMGNSEETQPKEFFDRNNPVPMQLNLQEKGYGIVTPAGANKRGWGDKPEVEPAKIREEILRYIGETGTVSVAEIANDVKEHYGMVTDDVVQAEITTLLKTDKLLGYDGQSDQVEKPDLIHGPAAALYTLQPGSVILTKARAAEKGWLTEIKRELRLSGKEGAVKFMPLLKKLSSFYVKGAKTVIDELELSQLQLPSGGNVTLQFYDLSPETLKQMGEFFETISTVGHQTSDTEVHLVINNPDAACPVVQELSK